MKFHLIGTPRTDTSLRQFPAVHVGGESLLACGVCLVGPTGVGGEHTQGVVSTTLDKFNQGQKVLKTYGSQATPDRVDDFNQWQDWIIFRKHFGADFPCKVPIGVGRKLTKSTPDAVADSLKSFVESFVQFVNMFALIPNRSKIVSWGTTKESVDCCRTSKDAPQFRPAVAVSQEQVEIKF
ncbi:unnamed protein product [Clavelina lepadiformis]|uniref:Uncharacterized protein n=1 Tax=Clavelina lepadiformis TaxID=159417 RepID=A0ABP0FTU5_CLALP